MASIYLYLYGPEADAFADEWTPWLRALLTGG
jgi:hypothetical protein